MDARCNGCGEVKERARFSKNQLKKDAASRCCKDCIASLQQQGPLQQNGLVRVRDVQRRYGHKCEIPLEAYIEADVAYSWSDFVSREDVQAASDAWDARSVAHEIDTQWGEMPWGGAYKDSNHYWGPGEYDYY
jgi:hypothetical protein